MRVSWTEQLFSTERYFLNGFLINAEFTYLDLEDRPMCTRERVTENWLESCAVLGRYHEGMGGCAMNVTQLMVVGSASGSIAHADARCTAASALLEQP